MILNKTASFRQIGEPKTIRILPNGDSRNWYANKVGYAYKVIAFEFPDGHKKWRLLPGQVSMDYESVYYVTLSDAQEINPLIKSTNLRNIRSL